MNEARLAGIYTAPQGGAPMESLGKVRILKGLGPEGDRYTEGKGFYQTPDARVAPREISIFTQLGLDAANQEFGYHFTPEMTRRNLLINGLEPLELLELIGKDFRIGKINFKGTEECTPCLRPSQLAETKENFLRAFKKDGRAGIRATVASTGILTIGDLFKQ